MVQWRFGGIKMFPEIVLVPSGLKIQWNKLWSQLSFCVSELCEAELGMILHNNFEIPCTYSYFKVKARIFG